MSPVLNRDRIREKVQRAARLGQDLTSKFASEDLEEVFTSDERADLFDLAERVRTEREDQRDRSARDRELRDLTKSILDAEAEREQQERWAAAEDEARRKLGL